MPEQYVPDNLLKAQIMQLRKKLQGPLQRCNEEAVTKHEIIILACK
jgi:hypothetical protein